MTCYLLIIQAERKANLLVMTNI